MPKKAQLYDVCKMIRLTDKSIRHIETIHYNIPRAMASFYVKTLRKEKQLRGTFFLPVKNGSNPLEVIKNRIARLEKICRWCNGQYNKYCTEQTNCLTVSLEAEEKMKKL